MISRILLVDPDVGALAALAGILRQRGLKVSLANGTQMACERAKSARFDAVIAPSSLAETTGDSIGLLDALAVETGRVPPVLLLVDDPSIPPRKEHVLRADVDTIFERLQSMSPASPSASPPRPPSSMPPSILNGVLARTPLRALVFSLADEKKTGTLTVTTANGAGEIRMHDGEIVDAVYARLEGVKAVCRLLGEAEGTFSFLPRTPPVMRRINTPLSELVRGCEEQLRETRRLRAMLGDLASKALFATDGPQPSGPTSSQLSALGRTVLTRLRVPATIDEVLDEVPANDSDLILAVMELNHAGRIKRLTHAAQRVPLAGTEELHAIRALASRARAVGYEGPARIVFAGAPGRLAVFAHTVLCLADTIGPVDGVPSVPVPHTIATVKLGDDVSLDIVALPLVAAYAPLWPMALAGSAIVVRLDDAAQTALNEACASSELTIAEADTLVSSLDEGNAAHVASLVRAALEA